MSNRLMFIKLVQDLYTKPRDVVALGAEDMRATFDLFPFPEGWRKFFVIGRRAASSFLDSPFPGSEPVLALRVRYPCWTDSSHRNHAAPPLAIVAFGAVPGL